MRKILSIMLAVALTLTTLAIPMSAFAADGTTMELVYAIDTVNEAAYNSGTAIYPGDEVTVSLSLKASVDTPVNLIELKNSVPENLGLSLAAVDGITNTGSVSNALYVDQSITITTAGIKLMEGTVTMPDASTSYTITANTAVGENLIVYGDDSDDYSPEFNNLTITPVTISVVQPTSSIKVNDTELAEGETKTIYASSATIEWSSQSTTATATYKLGDGEPTPIERGSVAEVSDAGTYTVTISYGTGMTYVRSFTLDTSSIDGTITTAISGEGEKKYQRGNTFEVPIVLSEGHESATVGMLAFTVAYDSTKLSIKQETEDEKVEIKPTDAGAEVVWTTDNITYLKTGDAVTTLVFTVLENAEYGNETITFKGTGLALEGSLDTVDAELGVTVGDQNILIMPETLATSDFASPANWTNVAYDVTVTTTAGDTVVYVSDEALVDEEANYAPWFLSGTALTDNQFEINAYKNYAIVTKLGDAPVEYQAIIITAADTKFDDTKPQVTPEAGMNDWLRTDDAAKKIAVDTFATVTDAIPADGVIKVEYYIGTAAAPVVWTESTDGNIAIEQDSEAESVTIKWTDAAGNATEDKTYGLKLDATAPVIEVTEPGEAVEGTKTVTFTVTDAHGEVAPESVKVYTSTDTELTADNYTSGTEAQLTGTYSFGVNQTTWYYIVASDKAGIAAEAMSGKVEFATATATTKLTAQVVKGDNAPTLTFYDTVTMAAKGITDRAGTVLNGNGTFTYAKITLPADQAGITTTVSVTKGGEAFSTETVGYEFTEVGEYVVTVTNKDTSNTELTTTFNFSIVAVADMMTVNGNSVYDVADYGRVRDLIADGETTEPTAAYKFYGGFYSGDLDGNGVYDVNDTTDLVAKLKARIKLPADSEYPILNNQTAE